MIDWEKDFAEKCSLLDLQYNSEYVIMENFIYSCLRLQEEQTRKEMINNIERAIEQNKKDFGLEEVELARKYHNYPQLKLERYEDKLNDNTTTTD